jgi:predicted ferric reductase
MNGQAWWYVTRASGLVAWALLAASVALGTLQAARRSPRRTASWYVDLHRGLSGLACFAIAAHLVALLADSFADFTLAEVVLPLERRSDTWGVTWGVATLYLVAAVEVTSLAQRRLTYRTWRRIHYLGLVVFWTATLHGVLVGTDTGNWALRVAAVSLVVAVAVVSARRVSFGLRHAGDPVEPVPR